LNSNESIAGNYTRTDLLKMVLEAGADIHATTESGWTALHAATASSWKDEEAPLRIKILIEAGADIHKRDRY